MENNNLTKNELYSIRKNCSYIKNLLTIGLLISIGLSCQKESQILGKYRAYSDNPEIQQWIGHEDNYIEITKDKITYNTTINKKPKFNIEGTYRLDKKTNELEIQWKEGKLPSKLKVEKQGAEYIITIGSAFYKKE